MMSDRRITVVVNGRAVEAVVPARLTLADFLRDHLGLTGTHLGCEHGVCGACTVLLDDRSARACLTLAVQVDGAEVTTVEGLRGREMTTRLRSAMSRHHGLQCGFCTPGFMISATELLREETRPKPLDAECVREALSGNTCRCTGYQGIVRAVLEVSNEIDEQAAEGGDDAAPAWQP
jgi:carbon-monoxide dehydrogenase small subunit